MIELRIYGEAAPQGSKTLTRYGGMREVSKKVQPWRASIQYASEQQYKGPVITGPVSVEIEFILHRAKSHWSRAIGKEHELLPSAPQECTVGGDLDKLVRGLLDPLTVRCGGNILDDDKQVVVLNARKRYADRREAAGAVVKIEEIWL